MQGWECPKCGRCYSPFTAQCLACPVQAFSGTTTIMLTCTCSGRATTTGCPVHGIQGPSYTSPNTSAGA